MTNSLKPLRQALTLALALALEEQRRQLVAAFVQRDHCKPGTDEYAYFNREVAHKLTAITNYEKMIARRQAMSLYHRSSVRDTFVKSLELTLKGLMFDLAHGPEMSQDHLDETMHVCTKIRDFLLNEFGHECDTPAEGTK